MLRVGGLCVLGDARLAEGEDDPGDVTRCLGFDEDPETVFAPRQGQFRHAAALVVADWYAVAAHAENALVDAAQPCWLAV
jgi:hypothetical protein